MQEQDCKGAGPRARARPAIRPKRWIDSRKALRFCVPGNSRGGGRTGRFHVEILVRPGRFGLRPGDISLGTQPRRMPHGGWWRCRRTTGSGGLRIQVVHFRSFLPALAVPPGPAAVRHLWRGSLHPGRAQGTPRSPAGQRSGAGGAHGKGAEAAEWWSGDGGLAAGSALAHVRPEPRFMEHAFLGPEYSDEQIERFMRDAKLLQIVEGTNQIQRNIVADTVLGRF